MPALAHLADRPSTAKIARTEGRARYVALYDVRCPGPVAGPHHPEARVAGEFCRGCIEDALAAAFVAGVDAVYR